MGRSITLKPSFIRPSQDFLKEKTLAFIFDCYKNDKQELLPPPPLVRRDPDHEGSYIVIDGHNLLAVHERMGTACGVYLADSAEDFLPNPQNDPAITQRNQDLANKFVSCVGEARRFNTSFAELLASHYDI